MKILSVGNYPLEGIKDFAVIVWRAEKIMLRSKTDLLFENCVLHFVCLIVPKTGIITQYSISKIVCHA